MFVEKCEVISLREIKKGTFLLEVFSELIAPSAEAGQFCNVKVSNTDFPLLRRPFSVCDVKGNSLFFMFDVHGVGTELLSRKRKGEKLDILGPLGRGFNLNENFDTAVLVAGGIGVAPFPFVVRKLEGKNYIPFLGGRSAENIIEYGLTGVYAATEDGSYGVKGNVIDLLNLHLDLLEGKNIKIFACGPNPMFRALKTFTEKTGIACEISTESAMACGFGICQGCAVESKQSENYKLICMDGPVFDINEVEI